MYKLTKDLRRAVCVHEAGHAIVYAIGGTFVERVAVAPEGAETWSVESRKGSVSTDLWGVCQADSDFVLWQFVQWDDESLCYRCDKSGFSNWLRISNKRFGKWFRQGIRSNICGMMAGPAAESIWRGEDVELYNGRDSLDKHDDLNKAESVSEILHWRDEFDHAAALTEHTLRRPEIWAMVLRLAGELERVGDIGKDELADFLPAGILGWPPSPRTKKKHSFVVRPMNTAA